SKSSLPAAFRSVMAPLYSPNIATSGSLYPRRRTGDIAENCRFQATDEETPPERRIPHAFPPARMPHNTSSKFPEEVGPAVHQDNRAHRGAEHRRGAGFRRDEAGGACAENPG